MRISVPTRPCSKDHSTNLVINTFIKGHAKRPPIDFAVVPASFVNLGGQIGQRARFTREGLAGPKVRGHIL